MNHKTWCRVAKNQWRKEPKSEDLAKDCVIISTTLRTFHIPPYEYLPIGLSIASENLYQTSLCMPKTVRSVLWLRHQDPMVEEWVRVIATFSIPALLLGIFPGDVGLGPGGICIIRFFSGSLVRMLCVFVVVAILKVLSTGSV